MVELIFTLDYEIYGNGHGTLRDLVLEPTKRLAAVFREFEATFVIFAEAVELPKIEAAQSDPDSKGVRAQLRELRAAGHEIALHLHPWWANARYEVDKWQLDWSERNIATLDPTRVEGIVSGAIRYLRDALEDPNFTPLAFRSGLWAMQPTSVIASVLARHGIRIDSSVFKGGRIASLGLDYRPALRNGDTWLFRDNVNVPDRDGTLREIPIHTEMVPFWRMLGSKRLKLQRKAQNSNHGTPLPRRWGDFVRLRYPRKLDFCRMTFDEMREALEIALEDGQAQAQEQRLLVAIGHSKDFVDSEATRQFLGLLRERSISVTTFSRAYRKEQQVSC